MFGAIGYALASLLIALGLLLLTSWRGRMQGGLLLAAAASNACGRVSWHTMRVAGSGSDWIWALEAFRDLAWLLFLMRLLERAAQGSPATSVSAGCGRGVLYVLAAIVAAPDGLPPAWWRIRWATMRLSFEVLFLVAGLVLVEQMYRNTPWSIGGGSSFSVSALAGCSPTTSSSIADALLLADVDYGLDREGRRECHCGAPDSRVGRSEPAVVVRPVRVAQGRVSHDLAGRCGDLPAVHVDGRVLYQPLRGEWSSVFQPVFFFGAGLLLVVLLFSGHLRSRVKVFSISIFSATYDYREEWLHLIRVLSGNALQASLAERVVYALCELVESPGGGIWFCAADSTCDFLRCWNIPEAEVDRRWDASSFCADLNRSGEVLDIDGTAFETPLSNDIDIPEWMHASGDFWLVVPLFHEDRLMGFVMLAKPRAPQALDWENLQLLQTAARQRASYLALDEAATALAKARQFEGFNRLSAFVVHDLKNLVAQLSLITRNAERYQHNPEFVEDAFQTVRNSVDKMNRLLAQLRSAAASGREGSVPLRATLERVVAEHRGGGANLPFCVLLAAPSSWCPPMRIG